MPHAPTIWINAGETSGDLHGQLLVQALRDLCPEARCLGMAGPAMRAAGVEAVLRTESLSVMGFTEVLAQIPTIWNLLATIRRTLTAVRPDVLVVIDAPDFHFRVIRIARSLNIPVIYYISPKVWAWRAGRVAFLRQHVQRLISILPFEQAFYARHHLAVDYVGHPLLDSVRTPDILNTPGQAGRIGILPGSRRTEITSLLPIFSRAAAMLHRRFPDLEFVLPLAPGVDRALIDKHWQARIPVQILPGTGRYAAMRSCRAIMAASGTATLETALLEVPTAVAYTFSPLTAWLGRKLVKVPYISLPNLILDAPVFPELLQEAAHPAALAAAIAQWIPDTPARAGVLDQLARLPALLGGGNATHRAADIVLECALKKQTRQ